MLDSDWEAEFARVLEAHPRVVAYVKNQGMQFEVPYRIGRVARRYMPDFIVRIDDGGAEPFNLVVEIKGYRGLDAQLKAETMRKLWVPGVNNLGTYGRWAFAEFREVFAIQDEFARARRAADGEGACVMARASRPKQVGALRHGEKRANIPTAEMQSFFQREGDHSPLPPKHYQRRRHWPRASIASATPTATRSSSGTACASP